VAPELSFEDRLGQGTEDETVVGRDQMDRPTHDADPHRLTLLERRRQRLRTEAGKT
jgi:hypothetical protein